MSLPKPAPLAAFSISDNGSFILYVGQIKNRALQSLWLFLLFLPSQQILLAQPWKRILLTTPAAKRRSLPSPSLTWIIAAVS